MKNRKSITTKANNTEQIRVIYKKVGKIPEVKIIDNVFRLKSLLLKKT